MIRVLLAEDQAMVRGALTALLGMESDLGKSMGLDNAWAANIIRQVGNYGEMFARDVTPLGLDRGRNALWTQGGLQFAPQLR